MPTGISATVANSWLDAVGRNVSYTNAAVWIALHVGDPGAAGTSNAATETTRKQATFSAASGGILTSNADVTWTNIAGSQDATHFSAWSASTSGTFLFSGTITANAYTAGDTYTIPSGSLTVSLTLAS